MADFGITEIAAAAGLLGSAASVGNVLFGGKDAPQTPQLSKPETMPTPDDDAARNAKKRSLAAQAQRRGRQSTILSDPLSGGDLLGGV